MYCSGCRWQFRHQFMFRVLTLNMNGISSTCPWHAEQPIPLSMWMLWLKYTKSGRSWTRVHAMDLPVAQLSRICCVTVAFAQICEWHVMHVSVGGRPANEDVSTLVWQ